MELFKKLGDKEEFPQEIETVNEFFRVNFRKLSFEEACTLLSEVSDVYDLEDQFWVWETLEEPIRKGIMDCQIDKVKEVAEHFSKMSKGSDYFWNDVTERLILNHKIFYNKLILAIFTADLLDC